jgi:hypothetical protein
MNVLLLVITGLSLVVACVASAIAWRVVRDERCRSEARVVRLTDAIYEESTRRAVDVATLLERRPASGSRYGFMIIGAGVVVAVITIVFSWADPFRVGDSAGLRGPSHKVESSTNGPSHRVSAPSTDAPLELVELEHERDGHRLVVRGLVRNPANGAERHGLMAVVLAYSRSGDLLASGRAAVLQSKLSAGETTPFVVGVSGADNINRIRVSFRTASRVELHVDRRPHGDAARDVEP